MKRSTASLTRIWIALAIPAIAQELPDVVIRSDTRMVPVEIKAHDASGRPVLDLRKEEFTITDRGKTREIRVFEIAANETASVPPPVSRNFFTNRTPAHALPGRAIVLLIDGVNSTFLDQAFAVMKARALVDSLPPQDTIALYAMNPNLTLLADYSTNRDGLRQALGKYVPSVARGVLNAAGGISDPRSPVPAETPVQQRFYMQLRVGDSLKMLKAIAERMTPIPGRKGIVWLTAAFPFAALTEFRLQFDKTVAAVNGADVSIYPVDLRGLLATGLPEEAPVMQRFAEETGGRAYYGRNDIDVAMKEAIDQTHTAYTLGFYPPAADLDGSFHPLSVKTSRQGVTLTYRRGYLATDDSKPDEKHRKQEIESALLSPLDLTEVGISAEAAKDASGLQLRFTLDPQALSVRDEVGEIQQMFVTFDSTGQIIAKTVFDLKFKVTSANRALFHKSGLTLQRSLPLAPGAARVRMIVQDKRSGRLGSLVLVLDQLDIK